MGSHGKKLRFARTVRSGVEMAWKSPWGPPRGQFELSCGLARLVRASASWAGRTASLRSPDCSLLNRAGPYADFSARGDPLEVVDEHGRVEERVARIPHGESDRDC